MILDDIFESGLSEGVNAKQIKKDLDSGMSYDAVIGKHANKRMTNTDEIRRVIQQHAWEKRMKRPKEQGVSEGILGDREYNRVMPVVKRIAGEVSDYDRDEFGEELWSLLDQKYGSKFAQSVLQDSLDFYWDEYAELTGQQGVSEGKKHISPSGVETTMDPRDDDYDVNYGREGGVAKFRKSQGLDVRTGSKRIKEQGVSEGHADQQRKILKKAGKPVGEIGIDRESSPGAGMYYMKHYASGLDLGGYDSFEEAMDELRYAIKQSVSEAIPSHIRPSDIPPAMRNRKLTMRDIEAERPQGGYRFRVGEKEFMDLRAAQDFAAGTGEKVERIREAAGQKKSSNARIERILKQLRARHPQAQDDLEALIYDFRSEQAQDDRDISRLDMENDAEEADIERLEKILANLKQQRALAEKRDRSPGKISRSEDPCWSGYHMVGTKKKNGREVPNCVPGEKGATNEAAGSYAVSVRRAGPNEAPVKA
jgi:hypothetical protein